MAPLPSEDNLDEIIECTFRKVRSVQDQFIAGMDDRNLRQVIWRICSYVFESSDRGVPEGNSVERQVVEALIEVLMTDYSGSLQLHHLGRLEEACKRCHISLQAYSDRFK